MFPTREKRGTPAFYEREREKACHLREREREREHML